MKLAHLPSFLVLSGVLSVGCASAQQTTDGADDSIVGGTTAALSSWAGAVAVFADGEETCGGTLVAPRWVLTAGHCVTPSAGDAGGLEKVVLGRKKLSGSGGEEIAIVKAIRHPDYAVGHVADLALLELATPSKTPVVSLLSTDKASTVYRANGNLTVVGWGTTSSDSDAASDDLLQVTVPFIPQTACKNYPGYRHLLDTQFCAGYQAGGKDSCQGDSGGPIYAKIDGQYVQAGVVSWGIGCAGAKAPGVYTRVTSYLDWITATVKGSSPAASPTQTASETSGAASTDADN